MRVVNSKNTWYIIFGTLFIVIVTAIVFNLIFKRTENKLKVTSNKSTSTLITQKDNQPSEIRYEKASPTPKPSVKPFFNLFNNSPQTATKSVVKASPTPKTQTITSLVEIDKQPSKGGLVASKSSDLKVISNKDGTTYLSTENSDGNDDKLDKKYSNSLFETIIPPTGYSQDIGEYINKLLRFILVISTLLVFGQLIIGGLQWITSGGDKGKIEEARNKLTAAVIGLIIVASSFAILQLALSFIGYQSINELMNLL